MIELVPFIREHRASLESAGSGENSKFTLKPQLLQTMEAQNSWTIMADGFPVACGGTIEHWPGRHQAWAQVSRHAGPHMKAVTRLSRQVLSLATGRIEMTVRKDFKPGQQWARLLGFSIETPLMPKYGPEGEDHVGYVLFQD